MNVAIVGSRTFNDAALVTRVIRRLIRQYPSDLTIISGGARGADSIAVHIARSLAIPTQVFPADWNRLGKQAGFIRNASIVAAADVVVALFAPGPRSRGTSHTISLARDADKPVHIYQEGSWS